jgi:hypothetical protein
VSGDGSYFRQTAYYLLKEELLDKYDFHGFPVVEEGKLLGYAARDVLKRKLGTST